MLPSSPRRARNAELGLEYRSTLCQGTTATPRESPSLSGLFTRVVGFPGGVSQRHSGRSPCADGFSGTRVFMEHGEPVGAFRFVDFPAREPNREGLLWRGGFGCTSYRPDPLRAARANRTAIARPAILASAVPEGFAARPVRGVIQWVSTRSPVGTSPRFDRVVRLLTRIRTEGAAELAGSRRGPACLSGGTDHRRRFLV